MDSGRSSIIMVRAEHDLRGLLVGCDKPFDGERQLGHHPAVRPFCKLPRQIRRGASIPLPQLEGQKSFTPSPVIN